MILLRVVEKLMPTCKMSISEKMINITLVKSTWKTAHEIINEPTAAEWLALWSSVQQFAGSIPASGLGVCGGSESTLNSRFRSF